MMRKAQAAQEYMFAIAMGFFFILLATYYITHSYQKPAKVGDDAEKTLEKTFSSTTFSK